MTAASGGSIYQVSKRHLGQIKLFAELDCLSKVEQKFLMGLLELCLDKSLHDNEQSTILVNRVELQSWLKNKNIGSGTTIVKRRSTALHELGLFKKDKFRVPKRKPSDLFILQDPSELLNKSKSSEKQFKDHRPHRQKLNEIKTQLIEADEQILDNGLTVRLARSERLWNGVFGSCMRSSRTDPRKREPFTTVYKFGKDQIKIITSSQTDSEICHVDDQRTIRSIITLACIEIAERIELNKEIKNEFFIDIVNLCELMGLDGSGGNRDTVRDSMKRLYSTNFNLVIDSESNTGREFSEQFGLTPGADDLNFRFFTELDQSIDREYGGAIVRRPRWYRVAFHSKTFQDLIDPSVISTFIDKKEILKVSSGLIHLFYTWCSIHVKRSGKRVLNITLPDLQRQMLPAARYDNFKDRFLTALRQHQKRNNDSWSNDSLNTICLFGYVIKMEPDSVNDWHFAAYRDKQDPVIGDRSMHNRLLHNNIVQNELDLL